MLLCFNTPLKCERIILQSQILQVTHLNDSHKQMMVHWVGEGSNVVICLSRDPTPPGLLGMVQPSTPSSVFISYDYGDTYENKTDAFKLPNGSYAVLDKFYNHPKYNTHVSSENVQVGCVVKSCD